LQSNDNVTQGSTVCMFTALGNMSQRSPLHPDASPYVTANQLLPIYCVHYHFTLTLFQIASSTSFPSEILSVPAWISVGSPHVHTPAEPQVPVLGTSWAGFAGQATEAQERIDQQGVLQGDPAGQAARSESRSGGRMLHQQAPDPAPPILLLVPPPPPPSVQQPPSPPPPRPDLCLHNVLYCDTCGGYCQQFCPGNGIPLPPSFLPCVFTTCCKDATTPGNCGLVRPQTMHFWLGVFVRITVSPCGTIRVLCQILIPPGAVFLLVSLTLFARAHSWRLWWADINVIECMGILSPFLVVPFQ
jgi:hypothetical protein